MRYICRNCGARSEKDYTLCSAAEEEPEDNFCGIPEEWICTDKLVHVDYVCESCGSVSFSPENLCSPAKREK